MPLAVRCVRLDRGRSIPLPHSKCWPVPRPSPLEDCSPEPCPARWVPSKEAGGPRGFHGPACKAHGTGSRVLWVHMVDSSFRHRLLSFFK